MANNEEPEPEEMGTWVNQRQDEPLPASHDDDRASPTVKWTPGLSGPPGPQP
jgi:hypothetical protein